MKQIEGKIVAKGFRFAIVVSRWNSFVTSKLLDGAVAAIVRHDGDKEAITVVWVPGSFEILHCPEIPKNVTINEAVEIGKRFGTEDSGAFIYGIIDKIARDFT